MTEKPPVMHLSQEDQELFLDQNILAGAGAKQEEFTREVCADGYQIKERCESCHRMRKLLIEWKELVPVARGGTPEGWEKLEEADKYRLTGMVCNDRSYLQTVKCVPRPMTEAEIEAFKKSVEEIREYNPAFAEKLLNSEPYMTSDTEEIEPVLAFHPGHCVEVVVRITQDEARTVVGKMPAALKEQYLVT